MLGFMDMSACALYVCVWDYKCPNSTTDLVKLPQCVFELISSGFIKWGAKQRHFKSVLKDRRALSHSCTAINHEFVIFKACRSYFVIKWRSLILWCVQFVFLQRIYYCHTAEHQRRIKVITLWFKLWPSYDILTNYFLDFKGFSTLVNRFSMTPHYLFTEIRGHTHKQ